MNLPGMDKAHVVHAAVVNLNPEKYTGRNAVVIGSAFAGLEPAAGHTGR